MKKLIMVIVMFLFFVFGSYAQVADVKAPYFSLYDLKGNKVSISDFKDKYVGLFFWTTRCPYCVVELKRIKDKCQYFDEANFTMLAINIGESKNRVEKFLKKNPICFNVLFDPEGVAAFRYDLMGVPAIFIINKEGSIIYDGYSFPNNLNKYLK